MIQALMRVLAALFRSDAHPAAADKTTAAAPNKKPGKPAAWVAIAIICVAGFEGYSGKPYHDSVGVLTICYGATAADHVDFSKVYSKPECEAMLGKDLPKYDAPLRKCLKPEIYAALPPHRHAALASLVYNIGDGAACKSSVVRDLNAGRVTAACDDFLKFNRGGGHVIKGLTTRRQAERKLCRMND